MYLLIRKISAYTGSDVFLGIFHERQEAQISLDSYRAAYLASPSLDPWKDQAYVSEHLSLDQFRVVEIESKQQVGSTVYVVSHYFDAFGQVHREFDGVFETLADAKSRCDELESDEVEFPHYAEFEAFIVGVISLDDE